MSIDNDLFQSFTGIELKENEIVINYQNEYNEYCFKIINKLTNEVLVRMAY